ncbi:DNA polymerase III delta prime subunit [Bisgaardia hudsonensis]|uniref:DNA polymerase III subunit delta' n=1 Tax=Bisgaardia hudsonensis TaxID=109472 RepID=A0A4R2MWP6_9PAST|nr:DNA polymerase III subunit delta' [Bisgaardia hudsonensis]QLB13654.1 DNA polymerase III subunit delta' [Bisgaardia hudsonensis]TCP11987.1 DNA polymerase III delta prime subunit [Bisgaardia hudsonensis]
MQHLYPWLVPYYQKITQAFLQGHGHHALLFKTEQGLGTEQLIQQLSRWLICQNKQQEQACNHCHSCQLFNANNHPDIYSLAPIENKDIGIDQVREINEKVSQFAQQNGNKIVLIKGANRLTESAANALLKTLEEPRENTYFLLQTDIASSLLATIHSRCQTWLIKIPTEQETLTWLHTQHNAEIKEIQTALRINYGRPLLALNSLQENILDKRVEFLRQFWKFYSKRSPLELLPFFDNNLIDQQLDWINSFFIDALKSKLAIQESQINQDLKKGILLFADANSIQGLLQASQIIQKVRLDLMQINGVNQEIILLDGLTKLITEIFEKTPQ